MKINSYAIDLNFKYKRKYQNGPGETKFLQPLIDTENP